MKAIVTALLLLCSLSLFSQNNDVAGEYKLKLETKDSSLFEYELTLAKDGTFTFYYHSNIKFGIPPETNKYGKGKWTENNNVVSFFCEKSKDLDEKYTLDFSNSKARFITKSPRDKTDKIVKTRLRFLESGILWMKSIEVLKI